MTEYWQNGTSENHLHNLFSGDHSNIPRLVTFYRIAVLAAAISHDSRRYLCLAAINRA